MVLCGHATPASLEPIFRYPFGAKSGVAVIVQSFYINKHPLGLWKPAGHWTGVGAGSREHRTTKLQTTLSSAAAVKYDTPGRLCCRGVLMAKHPPSGPVSPGFNWRCNAQGPAGSSEKQWDPREPVKNSGAHCDFLPARAFE
jgi:hypothetical protein